MSRRLIASSKPRDGREALGGAERANAKILSKDGLLRVRAEARRLGRRVVHCHGCFDIVHPGHLRHLRHARAQGDLLLVSITGDRQVGKGDGRPLIPQELRAENLAALDCVDWVYIEDRPTAVELLDEVQPDIYVKGREYELNNDPRFAREKETVQRHGGRVFFSSGDVVFSSSALIAALEQSVDPYHARLRSLLEREELDGAELSRLIGRFRGLRVMVVGEIITDTYVLCDRPDVAGESPIMTLRPIERRTYDGGAAIIARHLAAMGASPVLVTALPRGESALALRQRLLADGVEVRAIETHTPLPEKQRFLVGAQKVMKLDIVEPYEPDATAQQEFLELAVDAAKSARGLGPALAAMDDSARGCDAAIIADFGLGLLPAGILGKLCTALRERAGVRILAGDVSGRRSNLRALRQLDLLCPSESELRDAYRLYDQSLPMIVAQLMGETRTGNCIVTMGSEGVVAFEPMERPADPGQGFSSVLKGEHVPALSAHAVDALGCGDALLAAATLSLAAGAPTLTAAFLGSLAAAVQVQRLGNTVISATDLRQGAARVHTAHLTYQPQELVNTRSYAGIARKLEMPA